MALENQGKVDINGLPHQGVRAIRQFITTPAIRERSGVRVIRICVIESVIARFSAIFDFDRQPSIRPTESQGDIQMVTDPFHQLG
jgi:hypothetical protein